MISLHQVKGVYSSITRETEDGRFSVERKGNEFFGYYYTVTDKEQGGDRNVKLLTDAQVLIDRVYGGIKINEVT